MELADKLLAFKDDRQALIATLQHAYADIGMALPTLDSGGIPTDIDPSRSTASSIEAHR